MYIRKTVKDYKGKRYTNYLLVESLSTPKGPRQKIICSLGSLEPRPRKEWLALARKVKAALSGQMFLEGRDQEVDEIVEKVQKSAPQPKRGVMEDDVVAVHTDKVESEQAREAGAVHVGHQMWQRLEINNILSHAGMSKRTQVLTEVMVMNRLIAPLSEHAMPGWIRRTALADIVGLDFEMLNDDALYRTMDFLYPSREQIERELSRKEESLFHLEDSIYFYDLTSTYFEGSCLNNPQAKHGYSRDHRPDCKQVVVGLVIDRDGFPKAHEVFDGNYQDRATVDTMLEAIERRVGKREGSTVIVDRGMAFDENIEQIKRRKYHYIVACRQSERDEWLDEFEDDTGWEEVVRMPSPRNQFQKKTKIIIKRQQKGDETYLLCLSDGRKEKDRAIREHQEKRLLSDLAKLKERIAKGRLKKVSCIHQAIGRIKERYPRVARYHSIEFDEETEKLIVKEMEEKKRVAEKLDGGYLIKTDRKEMTGDEIWRTYVLLTRIENAFRNMKSPLGERPIFHHLKHRAQTHIFLCVLAYHLLVCIEKMFLDKGIHTSWDTIRKILSTHQVVTVVLPADTGEVLRIRKGTTPEKEHLEIYKILGIPQEVIRPKKMWSAK